MKIMDIAEEDDASMKPISNERVSEQTNKNAEWKRNGEREARIQTTKKYEVLV